MIALMIDTRREGFGLDQVRRTMTVGELSAFLEQFDDDTPIYLGFDNRYTYGGLRESMIGECERDDLGEDEFGDEEGNEQ